MNEIENLFEQLGDVLKTMDIPEMRKKDIAWLMRNLAVRNQDHPNFMEAQRLINVIRKAQSK
ncbi:MAG: hypothetical protein ACK55I_41120 [bacterium]|jgi:tRNA C32,U32 (ribose-2'-O)-methylase TrmJ